MSTFTAADIIAVKNNELAFKSLDFALLSKDGKVRVGPFLITYSLTKEQGKISVYVDFGVIKKEILSATVTRKKPSIRGKADVRLVKVEVAISVDFDSLALVVSGKACVKSLVGKWKCKKIRKRI